MIIKKESIKINIVIPLKIVSHLKYDIWSIKVCLPDNRIIKW